MKLSKRDIAEALGLRYFGLTDMLPWQPEPYLQHLFIYDSKNIWVSRYESVESAWEEAAEEFLAPLEKVLFNNL